MVVMSQTAARRTPLSLSRAAIAEDCNRLLRTSLLLRQYSRIGLFVASAPSPPVLLMFATIGLLTRLPVYLRLSPQKRLLQILGLSDTMETWTNTDNVVVVFVVP